MIERDWKRFMRMLLLPRYILLLVTIAGLLVITAGAGCSDDDTDVSAVLSIADVRASETTETTAVISWNTDVPATSAVAYGESSQDLSDTALDEELVTSHSVTLRGLTPDTTYYFKVESSDSSGNEVVYDEVEDFTTSDPADTDAPVISEVDAYEITESGATISWVTDKPATSQVEYGTSDDDTQTSDLLTELVTNHEIVLTGLEPGITYHFNVMSSDDAGNETVSEDNSFITTATVTADTTPPVISSVNLSATAVTWVTDEPATSKLDYFCYT